MQSEFAVLMLQMNCFSKLNAIVLNVKIYIFGARFNITSLQELAMTKLHRTVRNWEIFHSLDDPELIDIILHAFKNLPTSDLFITPDNAEAQVSKAASTSGPGSGNTMLRFWIRLIARNLSAFQSHPHYEDLIKNHHICTALLQKGILNRNPELPLYAHDGDFDGDDEDEDDD